MKTPTRGPGGPPLTAGQASTPVNVRVSSRDYRRMAAEARERRQSVPAIIRRAVAWWLRRLVNEE